MEEGEEENAREWGVVLTVVSHGLLPRFEPLQQTRDGREVLPGSYGIQRLMLD